MSVAVVIIAYSDTPSELELASFRQCLQVLGRHPLLVACPKSLRPGLYDFEATRAGRQVTYRRFEDSYFASIASYNLLMRSLMFYECFQTYDCILIYQLDAWVFRDELEEWCKKGYDYVGAPWFSDDGSLLPYAGNGGFSLRKVSTFVALLSGSLEKICTWEDQYAWKRERRKYLDQISLWKKELLEIRACRKSPSIYARTSIDNEDLIFFRIFSLIAETRVAPSSEAIFFAFERFPKEAYTLIGKKLPCGCHAFSGYSPAFWATWIPVTQHLHKMSWKQHYWFGCLVVFFKKFMVRLLKCAL